MCIADNMLCCAQAVAAGNVMMAQELLGQMKQHASPAGEAPLAGIISGASFGNCRRWSGGPW
jgi:hypothetical protein